MWGRFPSSHNKRRTNMHHACWKHHSISELCKHDTFLTFTSSEDVQKHTFCIDIRNETWQSMSSGRMLKSAYVLLIQNMACTYSIHTCRRHKALPPWGTCIISLMKVNPNVNGINGYVSSSTKTGRFDSGALHHSSTPFQMNPVHVHLDMLENRRPWDRLCIKQ